MAWSWDEWDGNIFFPAATCREKEIWEWFLNFPLFLEPIISLQNQNHCAAYFSLHQRDLISNPYTSFCINLSTSIPLTHHWFNYRITVCHFHHAMVKVKAYHPKDYPASIEEWKRFAELLIFLVDWSMYCHMSAIKITIYEMMFGDCWKN